MKAFLALCFTLFIAAPVAIAQIQGPTSAFVGDEKTYTFNSGTIYSSQTWGLNGGVRISTTRSGSTYTAIILWQTVGTGVLTFLDNNYTVLATL